MQTVWISQWMDALNQRQKIHVPVSLVNPFTGAAFNLPCSTQISPLCHSYKRSPLVFACDDSGSVILAACLLNSGLYYLRIGDDSWKEIESPHGRLRFIDRIVYHSGSFYILERNAAQIAVLDKETLEETDLITLWGWSSSVGYWTYLIVSSKELILIIDFTKHPDRTVDPPRVFKMSRRIKKREWIEVEDIGTRALFVDSDIAFFWKVRKNNGLKKNCIYFIRTFRKTRWRSLCTYYVVAYDLKRGKWRHLKERLTNLPDRGSRDQTPKWIVHRQG